MCRIFFCVLFCFVVGMVRVLVKGIESVVNVIGGLLFVVEKWNLLSEWRLLLNCWFIENCKMEFVGNNLVF